MFMNNKRATKAKQHFESAQKFHEQGRYAKAQKYYQKAISLYQKLADNIDCQQELAQALAGLADLFGEMEDYSQSESLFADSIALQQSNQCQPQLAVTQCNLAAVLLQQEKFAEALPWLTAAEQTQRQWVAADHDEYITELITTLAYLAGAHHGLHQYQAAEAVYRELIDINRELLAEAPEYFTLYLATTLDSYSALLIDIQSFTDALPICEEALALYQQCIDEYDYDDLANLAEIFGDHGVILAELKQFQSADASFALSLAMYRQLEADNPGDFELNIAQKLNGLACLRADERRFDEAKRLFRQSLDIYNRLAADDPALYLPEVAMVFQNQATTLYELGEYALARQSYQQALNYCRKQSAQGDIEPKTDLLTILNGIGVEYQTENNSAEALRLLSEALTIAQQLVETDPQVFRSDMALTQINLASVLTDTGQFEQAQYHAQQSLNTFRQLADEQPQSYLSELAKSLGVNAELQNRLNSIPQSERLYQEAIELWRTLATAEPVIYNPQLAETLESFAALLTSQWDFVRAHNFSTEALRLYRQLASDENETYTPGLASSLLNVGKFYIEIRDFPTARDCYDESLTLFTQLAEKAPQVHLPGLAVARNNYGALMLDMADFDAAIAVFEAALNDYRTLARQNPAQYNFHLAGTLQNLGHAYLNTERMMEARETIEECVALGRQLVAETPESYQENFAEYLNSLGVCYNQNNQLAQAQTIFEEAITLRRRLCQNREPFNVAALAMALSNLGEFYQRQDRVQEATPWFEQAIAEIESTPHAQTPTHISKYSVTHAYEFLLEQAVRAGNSVKAFALCAALRDGATLSVDIRDDALGATQQWLAEHHRRTGIKFQLLVVNQCYYRAAVIGLIDADDCRFEVSPAVDWHNLTSAIRHNPDGPQALHLSRVIFAALPESFQQALTPQKDRTVETLICSDTYWNAFPWELLKFGSGESDHLGLHSALPRIGAITAEALAKQFSTDKIGKGNGRTAILAPHNTLRKPLSGVIKEVAQVTQSITANGADIISNLAGRQADDAAITHQIQLQPDIFYYSGHGSVIQNEEVLVLHCNGESETNAGKYRVLSFFGRQQLKSIADKQGAPPLLPNSLIFLNCCSTGQSREAGGQREDLVAALLSHGAGAVIAFAVPIRNAVGNKLGEVIFEPDSGSTTVSQAVVHARRILALKLCHDIDGRQWGAWSMLHVHGNGFAKLPFGTES